MRPTIYLAGAIRDGRQDDIDWREDAIAVLGDDAILLNPLGGKTYDPPTKAWSMSGILPAAPVIVPHDFWMVERSDIIIFNMTALAEGYASIGTLVEFGHATALNPRPLIYTILDPTKAVGIGNSALYKVHPFLSINSAIIFDSVEACLDFVRQHIGVLSGERPEFLGEPSVEAAESAVRG